MTADFAVHRPERSLLSGNRTPSTVLLVGAGAVNLVSAWYLRSAGVEVHLVDARPDPLDRPAWERMGCTFGGYGARIFSLTEARQHHRRDGAAVDASAYRRALGDGGWLCCDTADLDPVDRQWIERHETLPGGLLRRFGEDIESFNVESDPLWARLRTLAPDLFRNVAFRDKLLRIYPTEAALAAASAHESSLSAPPRLIGPAQLRLEAPALADAVDAGEIAGALHVRGFSLDVQAFGRKLIAALAGLGTVFHWDVQVASIAWDDGGRVAGLNSSSGLLVADAYVLSPGAYGGTLLAGTLSAARIAAVAGGWVSIPNDNPALATPLKISRRGFGAPGPAEGANVVPAQDAAGREKLHISSGHGYLGWRPDRLGGAHLQHLTEAARQTAQRYFPHTADAVRWLPASERYCIRPWTATGLGVFETVPARGGGLLIVATGHNTGGFAQSPTIAAAVIAALSGEYHRMHDLYHPDRDGAHVAA